MKDNNSLSIGQAMPVTEISAADELKPLWTDLMADLALKTNTTSSYSMPKDESPDTDGEKQIINNQ